MLPTRQRFFAYFSAMDKKKNDLTTLRPWTRKKEPSYDLTTL